MSSGENGNNSKLANMYRKQRIGGVGASWHISRKSGVMSANQWAQRIENQRRIRLSGQVHQWRLIWRHRQCQCGVASYGGWRIEMAGRI
jgi:hypothetical protein